MVAAASPESVAIGRRARLDRDGRVLLVSTALFLLLAAAIEAYRFSLPTDGWSLQLPVEAPLFTENLLGQESPLLPGDRLLGVDGVPVPLLIGGAVGL